MSDDTLWIWLLGFFIALSAREFALYQQTGKARRLDGMDVLTALIWPLITVLLVVLNIADLIVRSALWVVRATK